MLRRRLRPTTAPLAVDGDRAPAPRLDDGQDEDDTDASADVYLLVAV
jgi:hypothetical protein